MADDFDAWDAEDFDPEAGFSKAAEGDETWEGEDEGLVIEKDTVEGVKAKPTVVTKKTKQERIEEKKAKRREEELKTQEAEKTPPPLSERELREERERQEEAQRQADLQSAIELFGVSGSSSIDRMNPSSLEEFEEFQKALTKKIIQFEGSTHFYQFLETLIRSVCVPLDTEDLRKLSSMLGVMASEKQKMKQPHQKKKKAKGVLGNVGKASKRLERDTFDDDLGADFDDFM